LSKKKSRKGRPFHRPRGGQNRGRNRASVANKLKNLGAAPARNENRQSLKGGEIIRNSRREIRGTFVDRPFGKRRTPNDIRGESSQSRRCAKTCTTSRGTRGGQCYYQKLEYPLPQKAFIPLLTREKSAEGRKASYPAGRGRREIDRQRI